MPRHTPHLRRLGGILLPFALLATLLSTGALSGQDADREPLVAEEAPVLPTAVVTVFGDGFLAAPSVSPVRSGPCASSEVGPVERAAINSPDTVILVDNRSCPGATLTSIASSQLADVDPDTDVVVIGGNGLEFDWLGLVDACLDPSARSASACLGEANVARATAANSFFSWRSVLQQAHRAAPDATIAVVAPPTPVGTTDVVLGSQCCGQSTDAHTQVRGVFDTAGSLRRAVAESLPEIPIIVVETDVLFDGHRMDDSSPWLGTAGPDAGLPNAFGVNALANRLAPLMPVGTVVDDVAAAPAEFVVLMGTTLDDVDTSTALAGAADEWFARLAAADLNPSVAVVPIRTTTPPPPVEEAEEPEIEEPAVEEPEVEEPVEEPAEGPVVEEPAEEPAEEPVVEEPAEEPAVEEPAEEEPAAQPSPLQVEDEDPGEDEPVTPETTTTTAAPETTTTTTAAPETTTTTTAAPETTTTTTAAPETTTTTTTEAPAPVPTFATTPQELRSEVATLEAFDGVSAMSDLVASLKLAADLLTPNVEHRDIVALTSNLDQRALGDTERESLTDIAAGLPGAITVVVSTADEAASLTQILANTGILVAASNGTTLDDLPAPELVPELTSIEVPSAIEAVQGSAAAVAAAIETTRPASATVTWEIDGEVVAVGQRTTIPTSQLSDGAHDLVVTATSDRNSITTSLVLTVSLDGDGRLAGDGCPNLFDISDQDIDGDGRPASCDTDDDGDGIPDDLDPCPSVRTDNLRDIDLDGRPDRCDGDFEDGPMADADGDGVANVVDNCPLVTQGDQLDDDDDGIGNVCEDQLSAACTIFGTEGNDRIRGTRGADVICALGGDDVVTSLDGNDIVFGGDGDDKLHGGADSDRLYGGRGNDELFGNGDADVLIGGFGNDEIFGGFGADTLYGDRGGDVLHGDDGPDLIIGGRGNDEIMGGSGPDTLAGERGNDTIFGDNGADLIDGGPGVDRIGGGRGNDTIITVESFDTVRGGSEDDLIDAAPLRIT